MKKLKFILLVDDDTVANYLNQILIEELGIVELFKSVNNGLEALQYLKDAEEISMVGEKVLIPELILLDLNMPILDGFEFLDLFNKLSFKGKESVKIVVLSSSTRNRDIEAATSLGAHDYLVKPLSTEKIEAIVSKHFDI